MDDLASLCGVRMTRRDRVRYILAPGCSLRPGELVVIELDDQETLGTVVVGTGQWLPGSVETPVQGRVLRIATSTDIRALGQAAALARGLTDAAQRFIAEQQEAIDVDDVYLTPDAARLFVVLDRPPLQPEALARELTVALQVPVELRWRASPNPKMDERPLSGVHAAGAADWTDWLVAPGADPSVLGEVAETSEPSVRQAIERLFTGIERRSQRSPVQGTRSGRAADGEAGEE
jgi:hypothetical protein